MSKLPNSCVRYLSLANWMRPLWWLKARQFHVTEEMAKELNIKGRRLSPLGTSCSLRDVLLCFLNDGVGVKCWVEG